MSKQDLFVCGSSVAAGWGTKKKENCSPLDSWPNWLASTLNVDDYYNYSMPLRTNESVIHDTLDFIEEYEDEGNNLNDVFMVMEFIHPLFVDVGTVRTKTGKVASVAYKPEVLWKTGKTEIQLNVTKGTLHNRQNTTLTDLSIVESEDLKQLMIRFENARTAMIHDYPGIVLDLHRKIGNFITYLRSKKIKYLLTWILTDEIIAEEIVYKHDKALYDHCYDKRFIKAEDFCVQTYCYDTEHTSVSIHTGHPSMEGHQKLANFLSTYIEENRLLDDYNDAVIIL